MALSCEKHTAHLYDRGGKRKIGTLDLLQRVKWERIRDAISTATVFVGAPGIECTRALGLAEAGRVELVVFRGNERVWEGPVVRITYQGDAVEIEAHDVMHYAARTIIRHEYDNRHPNTVKVLDRLKRIVPAELSRKEALDPPINVVSHIRYILETGSKTYERSYYNTAPVLMAISKAKTLGELAAAVSDIAADYGLANFGLPAGTSAPGMTWTPAKLQHWQLRLYMKAVVTAFSKYPRDFLQGSGVESVYFVRNLNLGTGFNVGGAATGETFYVDIADYAQQDGMVFDSEHIIHHELNHLMTDKFGTDLIRDRWLALNPAGFAYTTNFLVPEYDLNPPGFIRDYGRYSFAEDMAEVAAALFSDSAQDLLTTILANDPIVAAKVALYKEWMAAVSGGLIESSNFYKAIHTGTIVAPGDHGATDARTAARTLPYEMMLFQHIDNYAARGGIDYTVLGRSIMFFDVHQRIGQTAMVTKDDFIGNPIITQYGMELATYVAMTDGKGHWGDAGGVDPYYGEWEILHQAYDETAGPADVNKVPTVAELTSQAKRKHKQGMAPPLVVRIPDNTQLNPKGVLTVADLVPGIWIPLQASLPGRTVSQMQKLDSMTVEETAEGGEVIQVTLSPAYVETFVEDEAV